MKYLTGISALALSTLLVTSPAFAHEQGNWLVRVGLTNVTPDASSSALALNGGNIAGSGADVEDNNQLGLNIAYMFTNNLALEVLASTPFEHDIVANTGALGLGNVDAGSTKHLPPTVSLLWYPMSSDSAFQPYIGAGVNYTHFFEEEVADDLEGVLGNGSLELDASVGFSAQVGFDYDVSETMYLNASVRWAEIGTDAEFRFPGNNRIDADVDIDPFIYTLSLGWRL